MSRFSSLVVSLWGMVAAGCLASSGAWAMDAAERQLLSELEEIVEESEEGKPREMDQHLVEMVRAVAEGGSVNAADAKGNTALILAVHRNRPQTVAYLLRKGADKNHVNKAGKRAADYIKGDRIRGMLEGRRAPSAPPQDFVGAVPVPSASASTQDLKQKLVRFPSTVRYQRVKVSNPFWGRGNEIRVAGKVACNPTNGDTADVVAFNDYKLVLQWDRWGRDTYERGGDGVYYKEKSQKDPARENLLHYLRQSGQGSSCEELTLVHPQWPGRQGNIRVSGQLACRTSTGEAAEVLKRSQKRLVLHWELGAVETYVRQGKGTYLYRLSESADVLQEPRYKVQSCGDGLYLFSTRETGPEDRANVGGVVVTLRSPLPGASLQSLTVELPGDFRQDAPDFCHLGAYVLDAEGTLLAKSRVVAQGEKSVTFPFWHAKVKLKPGVPYYFYFAKGMQEQESREYWNSLQVGDKLTTVDCSQTGHGLHKGKGNYLRIKVVAKQPTRLCRQWGVLAIRPRVGEMWWPHVAPVMSLALTNPEEVSLFGVVSAEWEERIGWGLLVVLVLLATIPLWRRKKHPSS